MRQFPLKIGFTKQKHIRGNKTQKVLNFGPSVVYFVVVTFQGNWRYFEKATFGNLAGDQRGAGAFAAPLCTE